ncbi:hypothetical protein V6N11_017345 [Hibiscus sabdariffa]|uniref:NB-ARC domain-containing protein n=1 Tax=Hibiscus sabdariffa TaxID=183260 RepID=A0ABR2TXR0_9ROSI
MDAISHNPDTRKIPGEVADMLGQNYDKETISRRQMQLRERLLKTNKRVLIVLDDLWQKLDLEEIGISFQEAAAQKSSTAGCKLLLTSRSSQVLDLMDAERSFGVEILSQEESTIPFAKIVGLPVAISAIANALKRRDLSSWKDALRRLRKAGPNKKEMQQTVSSTIELSYNLLESEELLKKRNLKGCTAISMPHSNIPELFDNAQRAELSNLSSLSALDEYITNAQITPQDLFLRMLERYKIAIGPHGRDYSLLQSIDDNNFFTKSKASKSLELEIDIGERKENNVETEVIEFGRLCYLELYDLPKLKSFYSQEKTGSSSSGQGQTVSNNISFESCHEGVEIVVNKFFGDVLFEKTLPLVVAPRGACPAISVTTNSPGRLIPTCRSYEASLTGAMQRAGLASGEVGVLLP